VDDNARILFLSDCHRGDGGLTDDLWPNRELYLNVLTHYYERGYTYVEVGDGDELWKNRRFAPILNAHRSTHDLLQQFHRQKRLHLILGNHDQARLFRMGPVLKEGIPLTEGLVVRQRETGHEILVVHGHQADFERDPGLFFSRLGVRHFWRRLQQRGYWRNPNWKKMAEERSWLGRALARGMLRRNEAVEARLNSWLARPRAAHPDGQPANGHGPALLCGHIHVPHLSAPGEPTYLNTGCCIVPGQITGLELEDGQLSLLKWTDGDGLRGELLAGPRPLDHL
jgi:UDP-2,3-diacylglucosamine pyrophosphatase LpxH